MSLANLEKQTCVKNNRMKITPCLIMVDNSKSVYPYMEQVNKSMRNMVKEIAKEPVWANSIDLGIYSFNQGLDQVLDFTRVLDLSEKQIDRLYARSTYYGTGLGEAIEQAVGLLENRKEEYRADWIHTNMPNLIILSDFISNKETVQATQKGIDCIIKKVAEQHWKCIPVGVGEHVNEEVMCRLMMYRKEEKGPLIRFSDPDQAQNIIAAFQFVSSQVLQTCHEFTEERSSQELMQDVENLKRGWDFIKRNQK